MRAKKVRIINKFLQGFQEAANVTDGQMKNIRRNMKRIIQRSNKPVLITLLGIDINSLVERSSDYS